MAQSDQRQGNMARQIGIAEKGQWLWGCDHALSVDDLLTVNIIESSHALEGKKFDRLNFLVQNRIFLLLYYGLHT